MWNACVTEYMKEVFKKNATTDFSFANVIYSDNCLMYMGALYCSRSGDWFSSTVIVDQVDCW